MDFTTTGAGDIGAQQTILFITGSRALGDPAFLFTAYERSDFARRHHITKIIHGGAKDGIDASADLLIENLDTEREIFRPEKQRNAPRWAIAKALLDRNTVMAEICHLCLAVWDGESRGTRDAFKKVKKLGKPYVVFKVDTATGVVELYETNLEYLLDETGRKETTTGDERQPTLF